MSNLFQMDCYKRSVLEEDSCSMGSIHLSEGVSSTATYIRYHKGFTMWTNRTFLEKCLAISLIILLLLFVLVLMNSGYVRKVYTLQHDNTFCMNESCITAAANIISKINRDADACDNFYEYACGEWIRSNGLPPGKVVWSMFNILEQDNQLIIRKALDKVNVTSASSEAERKAYAYYSACMDSNGVVEEKGSKPLVHVIEKLKGWNVIKQVDMDLWDFEETLQKAQNEYDVSVFFTYMVTEDEKNSTMHAIQIDQGNLLLPTRNNYMNTSENTSVILSTYLEYIAEIGELLGGTRNETRRQMEKVMEFEKKLANITIPDEDRRDDEKMYHRMTIKELNEKVPMLQFESFFKDTFRLVNKNIKNDQNVVVNSMEYMKNLNKLLMEYLGPNSNNEKKTVIHNYVIWHIVKSLLPYLSKQFRTANNELKKILYGTDVSIDVWRVCISETNNIFGSALGNLYIRNTFAGSSKLVAEQMIHRIKKAFMDNLKKMDWMDKVTRKLAEEKADSIGNMIGFSNDIINTTYVDEKYKDLLVKDDEYFENNLRTNRYLITTNLKKLDSKVDKTRWGDISPSIVNAYYTPTRNNIVFPAGILQLPFYDQYQLSSLNYGAIGVVMGHELTHGFDDQGREYDKNGNLAIWWKNSTIENFNRKTQCFVNQYSKFELNGKHVNGKQTLGENIADNGGLKAAYKAYMSLPKGPNDLLLPALKFDEKQLFFIAFAQVWCAISTPEAESLMMDKDVHAPAMFRVNGPVSNFREFANAFNCPLGSKMNPVEKCEVW